MSPSAQSLFCRYFQRRVRIRSLIVRRNCFCPPSEQLSLFPRHDSDEPHARGRLYRLAMNLNRLRKGFRMKITPERHPCMNDHSD
jgi:hypothetical protein